MGSDRTGEPMAFSNVFEEEEAPRVAQERGAV